MQNLPNTKHNYDHKYLPIVTSCLDSVDNAMEPLAGWFSSCWIPLFFLCWCEFSGIWLPFSTPSAFWCDPNHNKIKWNRLNAVKKNAFTQIQKDRIESNDFRRITLTFAHGFCGDWRPVVWMLCAWIGCWVQANIPNVIGYLSGGRASKHSRHVRLIFMVFTTIFWIWTCISSIICRYRRIYQSNDNFKSKRLKMLEDNSHATSIMHRIECNTSLNLNVNQFRFE